MPIRENSLVHVLKWREFRGMVRESFTEKRKQVFRKNMNQGGFFMEKNRKEHRTFTTDRLLLRPWTEADAEDLYRYAKDPQVGPAAGWPAHTSVENSREIIRDVLSEPETYAICLKEDGKAIGSIGLMEPRCEADAKTDAAEVQEAYASDADEKTAAKEKELEIGFWLGRPFWGRGYVPEAVRCLQEYAFETLGCSALWCGYYEGNEKSKRAQEKCGFTFHHAEKEVYCPLIDEIRTERFNRLTKAQWRIRQEKF